MAKKKRKTNPAISDPKPEASEQIVNSDEVSTAEKNEISESAEDSDASTEPEVSETDVSEEKSAEEDEIIVSEETLAEIGDPDKDTNSYYVLDMRHPEEKEIMTRLGSEIRRKMTII